MTEWYHGKEMLAELAKSDAVNQSGGPGHPASWSALNKDPASAAAPVQPPLLGFIRDRNAPARVSLATQRQPVISHVRRRCRSHHQAVVDPAVVVYS